MKIAVIASEVSPFAKTGGLADVIGTLSVALELLGHQPVDVVHCHDWQTALAIVFLKTQTSRYPELTGAKSVFTIHNLGFQGIFGQHDRHLLNLDAALFTPQFLEFYGNINFLKGALVL